MRKISKSRVEDDVISSTNGSLLNDEPPAKEVNEDDGDTAAASDEGNDVEQNNDRESDVSYTEGAAKKSPKKSKKKTKKSKSKKTANEEYEVEKIVGAKKIKGKLHYLIRWKGYDADNDTWEPEKTVSCPDLVIKYKEEKENAKKKEKKPEKKSKKRKAKDTNKTPAKKPKTEWDTTKEDESAEYEVERIMEVHHKKDGTREFLIHWKGWSNKFDSWEPEANLNCSDLIKRFMDKVTDAKKSDSRSLRVAPEATNRFTLQAPTTGRRLSKRRGQRQRVRYDNAE